jgi:hypothetical protein
MSMNNDESKYEVIEINGKSLLIRKRFTDGEDDIPDHSRCSECNRFNRRYGAPDEVKVTIGKDGNKYTTPIVRP